MMTPAPLSQRAPLCHLISSVALLNVVFAAVAEDSPVGAWELTYTIGDRQRTALLTITAGGDGKLAGIWATGRGRDAVSDATFEQGRLSFGRRLRLGGRERSLRFSGTIEGASLSGILVNQGREIPVSGSRATPGALARLARGARLRNQDAKPRPTHADLAYGPDARNVLDVWLASSEKPTPVVLYIHGGGFRGGSKRSIGAGTLKQLLGAGISVVAVEYRLVPNHPLPAAHHDCRRAIQFVRAKAEEWNIDKTRAGAFGGSAGAQLCMWLAFHDDMADPDAHDPIVRESTRLSCVATNGGQTTMEREWWLKRVPGYGTSHRDPVELYGKKTDEQIREVVADISALSLISADDPPIHMQYGQKPDDPVPDDPQKARGWKIHHVVFGVELKRAMDKLGVEANLQYPGAKTRYGSREHFLIEKLTQGG